MTEQSPPVVLVVDDERNVLNAVRRSLRTLPVAVRLSNDPYEAISVLRDERIAVVIADQRMPGMTGLDLLRRMKDVSPRTVRILFTAYSELDVVVRAINVGEVFRFLRKPWDDAELQGVVLSAVKQHELVMENERLLRTVRKQQETLGELERSQPGLTRLPPRDESGAFIIEAPLEDGEWRV